MISLQFTLPFILFVKASDSKEEYCWFLGYNGPVYVCCVEDSKSDGVESAFPTVWQVLSHSFPDWITWLVNFTSCCVCNIVYKKSWSEKIEKCDISSQGIHNKDAGKSCYVNSVSTSTWRKYLVEVMIFFINVFQLLCHQIQALILTFI